MPNATKIFDPGEIINDRRIEPCIEKGGEEL